MEIRSLLTKTWENLNLLKDLLKQGVDSPIKEAALRWYTYALHQNVLDMLASIIAELNLRKPPSYSELALPLYELKLVDQEFVNNIRLIARNRNILAHEYRKVSLDELIRLAQEIEAKVPIILNKVIEIIESKNIDPPSEERLGEVLSNLLKENKDVIAVILFGSRARGVYTESSDYDLAILSSRGLTIKQLNELALKIACKVNIQVDKIDLIDLNKASNELIYKVIRDGKPIYVQDEEALRKWIRRNYVRVLDEEEGLSIIYKKYLKKLRQMLR